jgi:ribose transport system substrate-binding protein
MKEKDEKAKNEEPGLSTAKPVSRRDFLKIAGIAGATVGMGAGLGGVLAACGGSSTTTTAATTASTTATTSGTTESTTATTGGTETTAATTGKVWKIAVSMSYYGNMWQQQSYNEILAESQTPPYNTTTTLKTYIAGANLQNQLSQLQEMIDAGFDAILCYPISQTGLAQKMLDAVAKGVVFANYGNVIETPGTIYTSTDEYLMGQKWMEWLADAMKGTGKMIADKGVPGTYADTARNNALADVLKKFPNIKQVATFNGMWDEATSQKGMTSAIAGHPDITGLWSQDGAHGCLTAIQNAGIKKFFPIAGEAANAWRLDMIDPKLKAAGLTGCTAGDPTWMGAYAFKLIVKKLGGGDVPQKNLADIGFLTSDQIKVGTDPTKGENCIPADLVSGAFFADYFNLDVVPEISLNSALTGQPTPGATAKEV